MRFVLASSVLLSALVSAVEAAWYERSSEANILQELGPKLSREAEILLVGDEGFADKSKRWQWWAAPHVSAVVEVGSEEDVRETILYANQHSIPFLARNGAHGSLSNMATFTHGIQIHLGRLNTIALSPTGSTATLGGGVKGRQVMHALWAHGKQTVTGMCECVGLTAVALGGGHGILQGYHGLLSDQLLSLRIVLADGRIVIASADSHEHADLFWAMQGAGHNFGVVTSMTYRVYDVPASPVGGRTWSVEVLAFAATPHNVRAVYSAAQRQLDTQPEGVMHYSLVTINPGVSADPVILHHVAYNGPLSHIKQHTQALHDLHPLSVTSEQGTLLDLGRWFQIDDDGLVCNIDKFIPGVGVARFPVDTPDYDIPALDAAVQKFLELVTTNEAFAGSFMMIEQYPSQGVRKVDGGKSAFGLRQDRLLLAPALVYPARNMETGEPNGTLDEVAAKWGNEIKQILVKGAKKYGASHAYVNYAYGDEPLEEIYGEDKVQRLRKLKREYDPENRFRFYCPIEPADEEGHSEL